ncbi:serine/threonine-protein kinase-like protein chk1 [Microthyrium microscopicum]|uniref:Serine/threonine-protein kinase-like protein chk1 n=1 Tax=Microthyrium microscopicum TaxID=703497 RepID=A0A6A6UM83_9PEZI|nr:serine/threonine-protein kinase-like protein chk1 [Microthyrium microscopicum]
MVQAPSSQAAPLPRDLPFRLTSGTIGTGAYAFIRKAEPLTQRTPVIAVKFINKEHAFNIGRLKPRQLANEIALHSHLKRHRNIIEFLSAGEDTNWKWIAMELAEGGDLFDKIEADVGVGEDVAQTYFIQMINAVSYMHTKGVAHRDLKPENVLLSGNGDLKLADFGLASLFMHKGQVKKAKSVVGSPPYMAPEIIEAGHQGIGYEPNVSDIWSCGIVLFVLLVGNTPWDEPTGRSWEFRDFVSRKGKGDTVEDELWAKIPPTALSLLHGMLKLNIDERFSLEQVRTHPWFTKPNKFLDKNGQIADQIALATQMIENLHIDFNNPNLAAVRRQRPQDPDAMDVDPPKEASPQYKELDELKKSSSQPDGPMAEAASNWERPSAFGDMVSASQPITAHTALYPSTQLSPHISNILANDISLSQFTSTPSVPLSRTQAARRFNDIVPAYTNARFVTLLNLTLLSELISNALHRLGIPSKIVTKGEDRERCAYLQVSMQDSRGQGMKGTIMIEPFGPECHEVRFVKAKGDPLEWRRFFKNVCAHCKDAIIVPNM